MKKKKFKNSTTFVVRISPKTKKVIDKLPWGRRGRAIEQLIKNHKDELKSYAA